MTTNKSSDLKISNLTLRWFALAMAVCSFVGVPLAYVSADQTSKATTEARIVILEAAKNQNDARWEGMNNHLTEIEKTLSRIQGIMETTDKQKP